MRANAPAMSSGAIDYTRLLQQDLQQIDFYGTREHLATLPGHAVAHQVLVRAGALAANGLRRGDRIVMVSANTEQYLATLLAALLIGALPCAVAPPPTPSDEKSAGVQHLRAAIRVVDPKLVVAQPRVAVAVPHARVLVYDELQEAQPLSLPVGHTPEPSDVHHVQLTSGSTSAPKAVLLTHGNVAHNIGAIGYATAIARGHDRAFSWLPMYHDMGFIQVLGGLLYGLRVGIMTPLAFLRDPLSWVRHMTHHGSTHTAGPPFAYRATADAFQRASGTVEIDLSALAYAYVGAEPIAHSTVRYFTDTFARLGLRRDTLVPCYGMAESVLATTLALRPAATAATDFGRVRVRESRRHQIPVVSCGKPVDGLRLRVVDSDGVELPAGTEGQIQVSGPSIMLGYRNGDGSVTCPPDGWHDTGDRGFVSEGELFVVGRSKEMLIVRGRNFPPYDVERAIDAMPDIGPGHTIVFSVPDARRGRESVIAVIGTNTAETEHHRIRADVATAVRTAFGFSLDDIVLVPTAEIPRTTSGKLQRLKARQRYLGRRLHVAAT
ncbi:AMP-binding protein [Mycobacterium kansasii]|uniref:AMP-binding protein n=1 Tax=Mycobacterium kansasii TaxID=1768 RepID=UPI0015E1BEF2|nr:AMP-binding protein [Mycobacterium kansasii]